MYFQRPAVPISLAITGRDSSGKFCQYLASQPAMQSWISAMILAELLLPITRRICKLNDTIASFMFEHSIWIKIMISKCARENDGQHSQHQSLR
jgi:hypothetical protein